MTSMTNKEEEQEIYLFELEIDEDVYTQRKTSYKLGKADYPAWRPRPNWDEERLIQYRNGWSYSEWLNLNSKIIEM